MRVVSDKHFGSSGLTWSNEEAVDRLCDMLWFIGLLNSKELEVLREWSMRI